MAALAMERHEFGEHVIKPEICMQRMFSDEPDRDFFIYNCHFNPTVLNLSHQMAVLEKSEAVL